MARTNTAKIATETKTDVVETPETVETTIVENVNITEIANSYFDANDQFIAKGNDRDVITGLQMKDLEDYDNAIKGNEAFNKWCDAHATNCYEASTIQVSKVNPKTKKHGKVKSMSPTQCKTALVTIFGENAYDLCPSSTRSRSYHVVRAIKSGEINQLIEGAYDYDATSKSFSNSDTGKYVSYDTIAKKLKLKTNKDTGAVTSALGEDNSSDEPETETEAEEALDQEQTDKNFANQLDVFLTRTKKETSCDDKDALFNAMWIIKAKFNALEIDHSVLVDMVEGLKCNVDTQLMSVN
tara:strand:- start:148 stop:1038 length:891 start_codon:yes stop_codon:yes gene_type:complete